MKNLNNIEVGQLVRTTDDEAALREYHPWMVKWAGKTMTVREVFDGVPGYLRMEDDRCEGLLGNGWRWYPEMIDSVVFCDDACDSEDMELFIKLFFSQKEAS